MIKEYQAIFDVFRKGKEISNPEKWKKHQISVNTLGVFFVAVFTIAKGMGYDFNVNAATINDFSAGIIATYGIVNSVLTVITSKRAGF